MNNIFITGFMGAGKTSVGQAVARQLGWAYVDTDDVLERIAGKSIEAVFAEDGEDAFRALESRALDEVCGGERQVISTGGGIVKSAANRERMRAAGFVVCLEASAETVVHRLYPDGVGQGAVRPLLAGPNGETPLERARTLKEERAAAYADAHWTVHTDALTITDAAQEVIRAARTIGGVGNVPPAGGGARTPRGARQTSPLSCARHLIRAPSSRVRACSTASASSAAASASRRRPT